MIARTPIGLAARLVFKAYEASKTLSDARFDEQKGPPRNVVAGRCFLYVHARLELNHLALKPDGAGSNGSAQERRPVFFPNASL